MPKHALLLEQFVFTPTLGFGPQSAGEHFFDLTGPLHDSWLYVLRAFDAGGAQVTFSGTYAAASGGSLTHMGIFFSATTTPGRYELVGGPSGASTSVIASFSPAVIGGAHALADENAAAGGQHKFSTLIG